VYLFFYSFLNNIKIIIKYVCTFYKQFILFYVLKFFYLIINIFIVNDKYYFPLLNKFENYKTELHILYNVDILDTLYDNYYTFFWKNLETTEFYLDKNLLILINLYSKLIKKNQTSLVNLILFYLYDENSIKYLWYIKTFVYYRFMITNTWDYAEYWKQRINNFNMEMLPDIMEEDYFIHNYLRSWKPLFVVKSVYFIRKFIIKFNYMRFLTLLFIFFKNFIIGIVLSFLFLAYTFYFFKFTLVKTIANWVFLLLLFFWIFSTFNFFIKRYRFSKYTSAIQRFWKRAFMCFWLIEGLLFLIFFYYLLNASGEPNFMFDTYGFFVDHLLSIKQFLLSSFLIVLLVNIIILLLFNIKVFSLRKNIIWFFLCTIILLYILFVESYQFYYILNFYIEYLWVFSEDDGVWELDYDIPRTRNKNHYVTLIIVAKFWHYIFIFISWLFFLMKTLELKRVRYSFLSMNLQNIILFYIMNWLCLYSWFKWIFRRFMDQTYYWFFTSFRPLATSFILTDLINLLKNLIKIQHSPFKETLFLKFFYLLNTDQSFGQSSFFKKKILLSFFL
jgi:hypothetical protein